MPFAYTRTIHFADTDAAGVVYFARYLSICHEAYEESLASTGLDLGRFFADHGVVVPISRSEASYLRPLVCGDRVRVEVTPTRLSPDSFAIDYVVWKLGPTEKRAAVARTMHVCISSADRERRPLPPALVGWLDAQAAPATAVT